MSNIPTAAEIEKQIKERWNGRSTGGDVWMRVKPEKGELGTHDNKVRLAGNYKTVAIHYIPMGGKRTIRALCTGAGCSYCKLEKVLGQYEDGKALSERMSANEKTVWNCVDLADPKGEDGKFRWKILEHGWTVWKDIMALIEKGENLFDVDAGKVLVITKIVRPSKGSQNTTNYVAQAGKVLPLPKVIQDAPLLDLDKFFKPAGDDTLAEVVKAYKAILVKVKRSGSVGEDDIPF